MEWDGAGEWLYLSPYSSKQKSRWCWTTYQKVFSNLSHKLVTLDAVFQLFFSKPSFPEQKICNLVIMKLRPITRSVEKKTNYNCGFSMLTVINLMLYGRRSLILVCSYLIFLIFLISYPNVSVSSSSLSSSVSTGLSVYRDKYTLSHYAAAGGESWASLGTSHTTFLFQGKSASAASQQVTEITDWWP